MASNQTQFEKIVELEWRFNDI